MRFPIPTGKPVLVLSDFQGRTSVLVTNDSGTNVYFAHSLQEVKTNGVVLPSAVGAEPFYFEWEGELWAQADADVTIRIEYGRGK